MRPSLNRGEMSADQIMAVGLVWGHLRARQFEQAFLLATGCLRVWPHERNLILMHAYAAAEVLEPVDVARLLSIRTTASEGWIRMVLRRAGLEAAAPPPSPSPLPLARPPRSPLPLPPPPPPAGDGAAPRKGHP